MEIWGNGLTGTLWSQKEGKCWVSPSGWSHLLQQYRLEPNGLSAALKKKIQGSQWTAGRTWDSSLPLPQRRATVCINKGKKLARWGMQFFFSLALVRPHVENSVPSGGSAVQEGHGLSEEVQRRTTKVVRGPEGHKFSLAVTEIMGC